MKKKEIKGGSEAIVDFIKLSAYGARLTDEEWDKLGLHSFCDNIILTLVAQAYEEAARVCVTPDEPQELDEPSAVEQAYQEGFSDALFAYRAKVRTLKDKPVAESAPI